MYLLLPNWWSAACLTLSLANKHLESRQYTGNINRKRNKFHINNPKDSSRFMRPLQYIFMLGRKRTTYKLWAQKFFTMPEPEKNDAICSQRSIEVQSEMLTEIILAWKLVLKINYYWYLQKNRRNIKLAHLIINRHLYSH